MQFIEEQQLVLEKSVKIKFDGSCLTLIPADAEKFSIYKTIESKVKMQVAYRTRQCDMLSVPESTSFTWRLNVMTDRRNRDLLLLVSKRIKMTIKLKIHPRSIM